jgi:hypothetical protein
LKKEYYENLVLFFDRYYGGKAVVWKKYETLNTNMNDILREDDKFIV